MKVLVCGGRDFEDSTFLNWTLDTLHAKKPISLVIHGCARGADSFAEAWAVKTSGCTCFGVPADWKTHGQRAGMIRNRLMLEKGQPDLVLAFEGGAGTRDMTAAAVASGIKVLFAEKLRPHFDQQLS